MYPQTRFEYSPSSLALFSPPLSRFFVLRLRCHCHGGKTKNGLCSNRDVSILAHDQSPNGHEVQVGWKRLNLLGEHKESHCPNPACASVGDFAVPVDLQTGDYAGESTSGRRRWQQRRGKGKHGGGGKKGRSKKTANRFDLPV